MVAKSPRIGVGPGFDSQGSVTLFHKYCFPNLYWIHWAIITMWSDSAIDLQQPCHILLRFQNPPMQASRALLGMPAVYEQEVIILFFKVKTI